MSQQGTFIQRQLPTLVAQVQDRSAGQLPTPFLPHSLLPRARDIPEGTEFPTRHFHMSQHLSGSYFGYLPIPGHDFPKLGGPHPVMLPGPNTQGEEQESFCGPDTLDLDGFSIPFLAQTRNCGPHSHVSPVTSPLPTSYSSSLQVIQKQSRLPTGTSGRKAPRKSTVTPNWPTSGFNEVVKGKKRSTAPCLTKQARSPNFTRSSSCPNKGTSKKSSSRLIQPVSTMPRPVSSNNSVASKQDDQTIARKTPQARRMTLNDDASTPGPAAEVRNEQEKISPCHSITTRGQTRASRQHIRPQTRYKYDVPPELECVKRALGQDDWTEYLVLVEKHVLREVTEQTYNTISHRMYHVINTTLRKRIETMVVERMIGPVVGHMDSLREDTIEKDKPSENFQTVLSAKSGECSSILSTPSTASKSE